MDERSAVFSDLAEELIVHGAYKITKFISDKLTVKATRKRYKGKILKGQQIEILFTVGKPNYEERRRIKNNPVGCKNGSVDMVIKYVKEGKNVKRDAGPA